VATPSPLNLSQEVIERIALEERIRNQIRSEMNEETKASNSRLWSFLNSKVGMALLTSVLIAGVARVYTDHRADTEKAENLNRERLKITTEFDYRLAQAEYFARQLTSPNVSAEERQAFGIYLWRIVVGDQAFQPSLPEFKNVPWVGVVSRMRTLGADPSSSQAAFAAVLKLETTPNPQMIETSLRTLQQYREAFSKTNK